jgi:hypothetical protein
VASPFTGGRIVVTVLPTHTFSNDPTPEPWPEFPASFPTRQSFTSFADKVDPRDRIDWFEPRLTYADIG